MLISVAVAGCEESTDFSKIVGSYNADVTMFGQTDENILTLTEGTSGTVLFSFTTGLRTDPTGPSPNGLRASLSKGTNLRFALQPALLDHPTGTADGKLSGSGTLTLAAPANNKVEATFTFYPGTGDQFDLIQPNDGGAPYASDMGAAVTIVVKATQL